MSIQNRLGLLGEIKTAVEQSIGCVTPACEQEPSIDELREAQQQLVGALRKIEKLEASLGIDGYVVVE